MADQNARSPDRTLIAIGTLTAAAGLAGIGTWVAFDGGTREFSISGFISGLVGELFGRTIFGIGAIITWLFVAARAPRRQKDFREESYSVILRCE